MNKVQLEEKEIELEQRNHLLLKAKAAIDHLKAELSKTKDHEGKEIQVFEERLRELKRSNDQLDSEARKQVLSRYITK